MNKSIRRAIALVLALSALVLCFASCGSNANKIHVTVAIYGLENGEDSIWLGREMQIDEGKNADEAVAMLNELVSTLSYTKDNSGMYDSFKNGNDKLKIPSQKALGDDTVEYYHIGWRLNGEVQSQIDNPKKLSDHVMQEGDRVELFIQKDILKQN